MEGQGGVERAPCKSGTHKQLPFFDSHVLEVYLDDQRELKRKVFELFRSQPDLLPVVEEGLSKGEGRMRIQEDKGSDTQARCPPPEHATSATPTIVLSFSPPGA